MQNLEPKIFILWILQIFFEKFYKFINFTNFSKTPEFSDLPQIQHKLEIFYE